MDLIHIYKKIIIDQLVSWVLFRHGTCVMLLEQQKNIKEQAIKILHEHGSVMSGTPSGDYPGIMMYVPDEEAGGKRSDFDIGMIGRSKRERDSIELEMVHVEDKSNRV